MRDTVPADNYPTDDATFKKLALDAMTLALGIRKCLANHFHPHGGCLVPTSDTDGAWAGYRGSSPYKSGYKALYLEANPSESDEVYFRTFTRNNVHTSSC